MAGFVIQRVPGLATHPIRAAVLRPQGDPGDVVFEGDDDAETLHLGASVDGALVAVGRIAPDGDRPGAWRVRGMAVVPEVRGTGIGTALLAALLAHADAAGADLVWCNARIRARTLYERAGFVVVTDVFDITGIGPHVRMERAAG